MSGIGRPNEIIRIKRRNTVSCLAAHGRHRSPTTAHLMQLIRCLFDFVIIQIYEFNTSHDRKRKAEGEFLSFSRRSTYSHTVGVRNMQYNPQ